MRTALDRPCSWGNVLAIVVMAAVVLAIGAILSSCGGVETVAGDTYSTFEQNEGRPTWARTVGFEKWCETFIDDKIQGSPVVVAAFDLRDWDAYWHPLSFTFGKSFVMEKGRVIIDGVEKSRPSEPRVKWVRYNFRALDGMLPRAGY